MQSFNSEYNKRLLDFSKKLQHRINDDIRFKRVSLIVTTSRKMARLFQIIRQSGQITLPKNAVVISEYAIRYCLDSMLSQYGERLDIIVLDDIVNTGRTIRGIAGYISMFTSRNPFYLPFLVRSSAGSINNATILETSESASNAFINYSMMRNVDKIMSVGMPIDMEYPIVKYRIGKTWDVSLFESRLREVYTSCTVYRTEHIVQSGDSTQKVSNITLLLDQDRNKLYASSDFSKIRFFIGDDTLTIEVYSPKTIDETIFSLPRQFKNEALQNIWSEINLCEMPRLHPSGTDDLGLETLSKVVFINYLYSFVILKDNAVRLSQVLNDTGITSGMSIDSHNLELLVSSQHSSWIKSQLDALLEPETSLVPEVVNLMYSFDEAIKDEHYRSSYDKKKMMSLFNCNSVFEGLTSIFNIQKSFLNLSDEFGESFQSLISTVRMYIISEETYTDVHKGIDFMIDEGVVTPSYMPHVKKNRTYWRRMFQAGDRQNLLDDISQILYYVITEYLNQTHRRIVETSELSSVLSMIMKNRFGIPVLPRYSDFFLLSQQVDKTELYVNMVNEINILDYMVNNSYLDVKTIENRIETYELIPTARNAEVEYLQFMDEESKKTLCDVSAFIWKYSKHNISILRYSMLKPSTGFLDTCLREKIGDLLKKIDKYSINGIRFWVKDLHESISYLQDLLQGYRSFTANTAKPLDENESDTVKQLWHLCFDEDSEMRSDSLLMQSRAKLFILISFLLIIDAKFYNDDDQEARYYFDFLKDRNLSHYIDIKTIDKIISKSWTPLDDYGVILDFCRNILNQISQI